MRRPADLLAGLLLALPLAAACSGDPVEEYCAEVEAQQDDLTDAVAAGGPTALIEALPILEELAAASPSDLRDEWEVIVGRVTELRAALDDAGVDAATYDAEDPPAGLDPEARARITAAGRELAARETVQAFAGVQQQARDVCGTPLTL